MNARVLAVLVALASCAAPQSSRLGYGPMVDGSQVISITARTMRWESTAPPFYQLPGKQVVADVQGGSCTLRNDRGEWVAPLPGQATIATGGSLRVECRAQGYKPQSLTLSCTTPKARGALEGAFAPLAISPQLTAVGVVAAPAAVVGVMLAGAIVGSEATAAAVGREASEACDYSRTAIAIYLWPDERIEEPW